MSLYKGKGKIINITLQRMDKYLLDKFLMDEATEKEIDLINEWVRESADNEKEFQNAYKAHVLMALAVSKKEMSDGLGDLHRGRIAGRIRRIAAYSVSVAAAVALGIFINWYFAARPLADDAMRMMSFRTAAGQRASVTLPDGTTVEINSGSTLEYPAVFSKKERRVRIDGEALFDVAKDAGRPFLVETFAYDVRVLGTRFDILAEEETGEFCTALMEGSVAILDKEDSELARLRPDQIAKVVDGRLQKIQAEGVASQYRWAEGIVNCSGLSFKEMMRTFEKSFGVTIVIDREDVPDIRLKRMKVNVNDGITYALEMLKQFADFQYEHDDRTDTYHIR